MNCWIDLAGPVSQGLGVRRITSEKEDNWRGAVGVEEEYMLDEFVPDEVTGDCKEVVAKQSKDDEDQRGNHVPESPGQEFLKPASAAETCS